MVSLLLVSMTCCSLGFLALSSLGYLGASLPELPAVSLRFCFLPGVHVFFIHGFRLPLRFSLSFFLSRLRGYALRFPFCNSFSFGLHPGVSASAFPGYCVFRSSVILFLSLCMGAWSACRVFQALRLLPWFTFLSLSFSFVTSFPSLGALLTRSNLHYTPRRGLPLGRVSSCLASLHSSFTGLRTPSVLFSMSLSSFFSSVPFPVDGPLGFPFFMGLLSFCGPSPPSSSVLCWFFLGVDFPVGFLTFRFGSSLLVSPPVGFPFRVSSACSYSGPRSGFSLHSSVFPSFVTRSNLSSFATGSSLRAESRLSGFSCILSPGVTSCPLLLVSFLVCSDFSPYFSQCVGYHLLRRVFLRFLYIS